MNNDWIYIMIGYITFAGIIMAGLMLNMIMRGTIWIVETVNLKPGPCTYIPADIVQ